MKKLGCFILGVVSYIVAVPILESLTECICGKIEVFKGKNTKEVLILNNEIADLQEKLEPQYSNCIGFEYNPNSEEYYYDEDDDDWEEDRNKNKIGF